MYYAKTASKVREQIIQFSGELSLGWPKVARRFLSEAIYGIQARQSVHLTEMARALGEKISFLTRWRIEETIRFMKQSYRVEDIRLLTCQRLQNMMAILTAVAYFAMVYLGLRTKLRVLARHVMGASRRLFGIPDFHFYALADGIREYLFGRQTGLKGFHHQWIDKHNQLSLFDP